MWRTNTYSQAYSSVFSLKSPQRLRALSILHLVQHKEEQMISDEYPPFCFRRSTVQAELILVSYDSVPVREFLNVLF
jgi:hypothetical protein